MGIVFGIHSPKRTTPKVREPKPWDLPDPKPHDSLAEEVADLRKELRELQIIVRSLLNGESNDINIYERGAM